MSKLYVGLCVTEKIGNNSIKCECTCPDCGKHQECVVTLSEFYEYQDTDKSASKVFKNLSMAEREMFVTGLCNDCWKEHHPEYVE